MRELWLEWRNVSQNEKEKEIKASGKCVNVVKSRSGQEKEEDQAPAF